MLAGCWCLQGLMFLLANKTNKQINKAEYPRDYKEFRIKGGLRSCVLLTATILHKSPPSYVMDHGLECFTIKL